MSFKDILTEDDRKAFEKGGYGKRMGYGARPALLVVDVTYSFIDPAYDQAYGDTGWKAVEALGKLIPLCRKKGIPVIYTTGIAKSPQNIVYKFGISRKKPRGVRPFDPKENEIVKEIAPLEGELVITKPRASAFFETGLVSILTHDRIDTIIVAGATTSGCIRATVVDGASYGYYVIIPEETVADRAVLSHKVNLLDMDMKYADVEPLENVLKFVEGYQKRNG